MRKRKLDYLCFFLVIFLAISQQLFAQQPTSSGNASTDTQALLDRIQQLEKRVQELEAHAGQGTAPSGTQADSTLGAASSTQVSPDLVALTGSGLKEAVEKNTGLQIRGFGQVTYLADDLKGDRPSYYAGNFTLLMTSQLSDKLSAISELAIDEEGYGSARFSPVLERAVLQYEHNDYLKIAAGRYFTSIGYYNTAFYNADWAQTTTRRPVMAAFQDDGGLMPMQRNGVSISGRLPVSENLGLHYVAEIGGGDIDRSDILGLGYDFQMQARTGFNFAMFARPRAVNGLQVGGSFYHDTEIPYITGSGDPLVRQNVSSAYMVYNRSNWEVLNEAYLIQHHVTGFRDFNIPTFYTQISHRLTPAWRPYFRFSYLNAGQNDPMLPDLAGHMTGIEAGARYNFSEWVGLKLEYSRMQMAQTKTNINFGGSQLVFTF